MSNDLRSGRSAWGWEPTTIEAIKAYRPSSNSISSGQVLHCPYETDKAKLVVREMTDLLVLDLVDKGLVTDQMVLTVGYDIENLTDPARRAKYHGAVEKDPYGREIPKQAHGSINLDGHTSSTRKIMCAVSDMQSLRIINERWTRMNSSEGSFSSIYFIVHKLSTGFGSSLL